MPLPAPASRPAFRTRLPCLACCALTAAVTLLAPVLAFAQRRGEEEGAEFKEARLEGYAFNVKAPEGGAALIYLLFIFLAVLGLAVLFKNARRTHLD